MRRGRRSSALGPFLSPSLAPCAPLEVLPHFQSCISSKLYVFDDRFTSQEVREIRRRRE
jgi:hypothetical protein